MPENPAQTTLRVSALPAFQDNYLWVLDDGQFACAIDPGDAAPVQAWLAQANLTLSAILLTHHHPDHTGGVADLLGAQPDLPVYGPALDEIGGVNHPLLGDETLQVLGADGQAVTLQVLPTPGHTHGHIAYFLAGQAGLAPQLFCGDTLFSVGCGRLFEGTPEQMHASLQRLAQLPSDTRVCCAHEYTLSNIAFALAIEPQNPALQAWASQARQLREAGKATVPTTLAQELATNPFLRCTEPTVQAAVKTHMAQTHGGDAHLPMQPSAVFAALRAWKNTF